MKQTSHQQGYILVATILLSIAISIVAITFMQYTANTSSTLNAQNYQDLAKEAADSGIAYAHSCMSTGTMSWPSMTPGTTCTGTSNGGSTYMQTADNWRSTFSVSQPDAVNNVISTGTVEIMRGSTVVDSYTTTSKMNIGSKYTYKSIASGEVITDLKAQNVDCAIANGKLYCWGRNNNGEVGDNTTTDRSNPTLVQGALAGKTVTHVDVSDVSVCAIADGTPYCWGQNLQGQLGSGNKTAYRQPTANVPTYSSGDLSGSFVTEISTSPANIPTVIWPVATAVQHTCALKANGSVACWGTNGYRQLTKKTSVCLGAIVFGNCIGVEIFYYPDNDSPDLVNGYSDNTGPFAGKKAERVAASSHDSCMLSQGRTYCWGVEVPLNITCGVPGSPLFYPSNVVNVNLNPCTQTYSAGYDMSSKQGFDAAFGGFEINTKKIDPESWQLSTNILCGMANTDFFCAGTGATVGFQFLPSFNPPWKELPNADITSHDNGDNESSASLDGMYCAVDKGVAKCMTSIAAISYSGGAPWQAWGPINTTTGLADNKPTKIAAGTTHGCTAANGQLYCWGFGSNGRLANGSTASITYPTRTGTGGSTPIGTNGTDSYAADGPISVGGSHACATANGRLFCWGEGDNGRLGTGNDNDTAQPQAVPFFATDYITKVSAGTSHTCAIRYGQLYCWGLNSTGQLGVGDKNDRSTPTQVTAFIGKRVTDVSAGDNNTCAIADGQAYCWGNNFHKKLGDGTSTERTSPVIVNGHGALTTAMAVTKISAGTDHTCAVANSDAYCWGWNMNGRTGLNTTANTDSDPTLLSTASSSAAGTPTGPNGMRPAVSDIAAGGEFSCGIFNGKVACWGKSNLGQTGTNTTSDRAVATIINGAAGGYYATSVSAGTSHACALIHGNNSVTNGNIWCWGAGADGRLGNNSSSNSTVPVLINCGGTTIPSTTTSCASASYRRSATSIAAGAMSTCSVANGVILCWGNGSSGQLATGGTASSSLPVESTSFRFIAPYQKGPVF